MLQARIDEELAKNTWKRQNSNGPLSIVLALLKFCQRCYHFFHANASNTTRTRNPPIRGVDLIYLFGSAARGDMHRESDVDVALHATRPLTLLERMHISRLTRRTLPMGDRDIDLVDLRYATPELAMQIVQDGKRILGTDRSDDAFYRLSIKRYVYAKKIRDAEKAYVKRYAPV